MNPELEAYVARARNPQLIPGIYNYCDHRCERCPFTTHCLSFREEHTQGGAEGERNLADHIEAHVDLTAALIHSWCERHGIDEEKVQDEANSAAVKTAQPRDDHAVDSNPLQIAAWQYSKEAYDIVEPLKNLSGLHAWPSGVGTAIDAIAWHSGMIPAKVCRALHGLANQSRFANEDPVQNDWNGSAKVARLAIAESLGAWNTLFVAGETPPDAPIRRTTGLLEGIDRDLEERFPLAMDFVRPGFDEPDVTAGALATLAPFEPRHPRSWRRLRAWWSRVLGRKAAALEGR
jgi:hypothetical protein